MNWFKFYSAWGEGLQELSDAEAGRFIKALCACAGSEEIPTLTGAEKVLYAMASKQLKRDADNSANISSARAEAGRKGGLNSRFTQANESKTSNCLQTKAKQAIASNSPIKNSELRIQNSEEIKERDIEKEKPQKHRYGNFKHVFLTDEDYTRLQADFPDLEKRIQKLDDYLENNPSKHYANHCLTIRTWANKDAQEAKAMPKRQEPYKSTYQRLKEMGEI